MKKSKIAIIVTISVLSLIVLLLVGLLVAAVSVVNKPERTLFGYRLFLADRDTRNCSTGDLLLVRPVAPAALEPDDCIVCRAADGSLLIYTFLDHTSGGTGLVAFDPDTTDYKEIAISADDILGRLEKTLPVAGDIIGAFAGNPSRDNADGVQQTLPTEPKTTPSPTDVPAEPKTEPETAPESTRQTEALTDDRLAASWFSACLTFVPTYDGGPDEELLNLHSLVLGADGTFNECKLYYVRIDPDAWQMGDPYMLVDGTYWGIPSMGFPDRNGTWSFDDGLLTLNYDYDIYYDTPPTTLVYAAEMIDGELYVESERFIVSNGATTELCEAFGIPYK